MTGSGQTWRQRAACRGLGPDRFFVDDDAAVAAARAICERCAVRAPCLTVALANREWGVWGGTTEQERIAMRRRTRRGRRATA